MQALMHACWVGFAKTGRPDCAGWPGFTTSGDQLLEFGDTTQPVAHFRGAQYQALEAALKPQ